MYIVKNQKKQQQNPNHSKSESKHLDSDSQIKSYNGNYVQKRKVVPRVTKNPHNIKRITYYSTKKSA